MLISTWTYAIIALFNWQYDYTVKHLPMDTNHIHIDNSGHLVTCIYPQDRPFKKGSKTYARSELRSLEEPKGDKPYVFEVETLSLPNTTDYSVWQVFGEKSPLLMVRHRQGKHQLVVFDGQPKIQVLPSFPKKCVLDCPNKTVTCDGYKSTGNLKCSSLYFKIGVYSQQRKPPVKMCIAYGKIKYFSLL